MALVDTIAEQHLLEDLLDRSKPRVPPECSELHYLLATPFRYGAPYPAGSRFRRSGMTPGVFYASQTTATAVAEIAFHRLLFYADSPGTPWPANASEYTAFAVRFRAAKALDLTAVPFARQSHLWSHPTDYTSCQALAEAAFAAGVHVIGYQSARAPGRNVALLSCAAFASREPLERQVWRLHFGRAGVRAICAFPDQRLGFDREAFATDPRLGALRWER